MFSKKLNNSSPIETKWALNPHSLFPNNMMDYAGHRLQIVAVSIYHLGIVLYELREIGASASIPGQWLEKTMVDQMLESVDESPFNQVASQIYRICKGEETIDIQDDAGTIYCTLRKHDLNSAFEDISRVGIT